MDLSCVIGQRDNYWDEFDETSAIKSLMPLNVQRRKLLLRSNRLKKHLRRPPLPRQNKPSKKLKSKPPPNKSRRKPRRALLLKNNKKLLSLRRHQ